MSGHLPGREAKKPKRRPMKRLEQAIDQGRVRAFDRALEDCLNSTHSGNWQHRALGLVMGAQKNADHFMRALMNCPSPPLPSSYENFMGMAVIDKSAEWTVPYLVDAGFKIKPAQSGDQFPLARLSQLVVWGQVNGYRPVLASVLGRSIFQGRLEEAIKMMDLQTHGDGFLSPSSASMLAELFKGVAEAKKTKVTHGMSHAFGTAVRRNIEALENGDFQWHEGYGILRQAGVFDLDGIREGVGLAGGYRTLNAMTLVDVLEARISSNSLDSNTPELAAGGRVLRI